MVELEPGETAVLREPVLSDDTGESAWVTVTSRRLLIEYETVSSGMRAVVKSTVHGEPPQFHVHLRWSDLREVKFIRRHGGAHLLRVLPKRGPPTLWQTSHAELILRAITEVAGPIPTPRDTG